MPDDWSCVRWSLSSAAAQSPESSAPSSDSVAASSRAAPGGATASDTTPPSCGTNAVCGPVAPVTAQSTKLGAQPAIERARSR